MYGLKKTISLFFCVLILIFSLCSCEDEFDPDEYIGEGLLTQFSILVDANQHFYNEVFVLSHLPVNEDESFEYEGKTYAPVNDTLYTSYDKLIEHLNGIYTEEAVEDILENYDYYRDIDGKLCFDMAYADSAKKGVKWERDPEWKPELEGKKDGMYTVEFGFKCGQKDEIDEFDFVRTDAGNRLTKLQYVN